MIEQLSQNLVNLKTEFVKIYDGSSQIHEVIPAVTSELFPIVQKDLDMLHQFAKMNPIYYNSYEKMIGDVLCVVYEGDINKYWLNSIQHGSSSHAPFSPTWILSAYLCVLHAKNLGYLQVIDIGSGDGRIAFCAKVLNLESYSIEIDEMLIELQKSLVGITDFHPICFDAVLFDYSTLNLSLPVFFIGGLAQMGGVSLASGVFEKTRVLSNVEIGWVFAGTSSPKYAPDPKNEAGWGSLMAQNNLHSIKTLLLPTAWTSNEPEPTPYIFAQTSL